MFRASLFSVSTVFATILTLNTAAYAFDTTTSSSAGSSADPQASTGWDQAVENSLIFSNPFADTSEVSPTPHTYFKAGIANNVVAPVNGSTWQPGQYYHDAGTVGMAETGLHHIGRQEIGMGGWQYNANPDALTSPDQMRPRTGIYVLADRTFYNQDHKTIVGFARAGHVDDVDQRRNGWSAGFAMKGFVQDRPDGQFNFMVTGGRNPTIVENDPYARSGMETHLELTYEDKITDNITIQPGFNYTIARHDDPAAVTGLVAGLRLHISFK